MHSPWCPWAGLNCRPLPYQGSALPLSYMGILLAIQKISQPQRGAGEGNRTLVISLEGFSSTIELHPQNHLPAAQSTNKLDHLVQHSWWREKDSNLRRQSRQIYSLIPLTAWVSLQLGTENFDAQTKVCQTNFFEPGNIIAEFVPQHVNSGRFV